MMTDQRKADALQNLCEAVSKFGEVHLAELDDSIIEDMQDAIDDRDGRLVTQVESSASTGVRVTILLSHVIDDERSLAPLLVVDATAATVN